MVKDRQSINIWKDYWIAGFKTLMSISNIILNHHPKLVAELIHPDARWWDVEKIQSLFSPIIAAIVLKIPLPNDHRGDIYIYISGS